MDKLLRRLRFVSVGMILAGAMLFGGPAEPAQAAGFCKFCVPNCPIDVQSYCAGQGCAIGQGICYYDTSCHSGKYARVDCTFI